MPLLLLFVLAGCDLASIGVHGCDEYCSEMMDKAETCAAEQGVSFTEFAGDSEDQLLSDCQVQADEMGEAECQSQTGVANNATCDQLLELMAF